MAAIPSNDTIWTCAHVDLILSFALVIVCTHELQYYLVHLQNKKKKFSHGSLTLNDYYFTCRFLLQNECGLICINDD